MNRVAARWLWYCLQILQKLDHVMSTHNLIRLIFKQTLFLSFCEAKYFLSNFQIHIFNRIFIIFHLIGNRSYTNNLSTLFPGQFGRNCPQDKLTSQARSIHFLWAIYPQIDLEKVYLDNRIDRFWWLILNRRR